MAYDEKHWYGYGGWRSLRGALMKLATAEAPALLEGLSRRDTDVRGLVEAFVVRMVLAMQQRQNGSTKWTYGISLLGETELLISMIEGDALLNGNVERRNIDPTAGFWQMFPRFLNRARQRQGGTSEHRVTVWEMMDRVSRRIAGEQEKQGRLVDRMSVEHIVAVRMACLEKYPANKNVNVDLSTFRGYFEEFCEEARQAYDPDAPAASIDQYQSFVRDTQDKPAVNVCLDRLSRHDPGLWDALLLKLEMHPRLTLSSSAYAASQCISRYEIDQRYLAAAVFIRNCIETSLSMLLRR